MSYTFCNAVSATSAFNLKLCHTVSVLGQEEGYKVKYTPLPEGVPEGEARGNS